MPYAFHLAQACARMGWPCVWLEPIFPQPVMPLLSSMTLSAQCANDDGPKAA
ncbi:MAG: hypothetical protein H0W48_00205 [Methylibium sp.]|nr:hypothetical protein [Methylibium sp.]